jgi:hypothetical protein
MKTNYSSVAATGFKLLAAVIGGFALYAGLSKIVSDGDVKSKSCEDENNDESFDEPTPVIVQRPPVNATGVKIIEGLRIGQAALGGTMNIISGIVSVASNINRMFDPGYYKTMLGDPGSGTGYFGAQMIPSGYIPGNYPWNDQPEQGYPYNTPINMGKDSMGKDTYWLRKPNNIIEVW